MHIAIADVGVLFEIKILKEGQINKIKGMYEIILRCKFKDCFVSFLRGPWIFISFHFQAVQLYSEVASM